MVLTKGLPQEQAFSYKTFSKSSRKQQLSPSPLFCRERPAHELHIKPGSKLCRGVWYWAGSPGATVWLKLWKDTTVIQKEFCAQSLTACVLELIFPYHLQMVSLTPVEMSSLKCGYPYSNCLGGHRNLSSASPKTVILLKPHSFGVPCLCLSLENDELCSSLSSYKREFI